MISKLRIGFEGTEKKTKSKYGVGGLRMNHQYCWDSIALGFPECGNSYN